MSKDINRPKADSTLIGRRDVLKTGLMLGTGMMLAGAGLRPGLADEPKRGGTLRVGLGAAGAKSSLNPFISTGDMDFAVAQSIFDRLTDFDKDGNLYNKLADDFTHNAEGNVWKIKLKKGVVWHDGAPFTAKDVVYTIQYILNSDNKADAYPNLAPLMEPKGVRALDPNTVEVELKQPYALLPQVLGSKVMFLMKDGTTDFDKPIGTGPFKFVSWSRGQRVTLARSDNYRTPDQPYLDGVEFIAINDPTARMNALVANQVDAVAQLDGSLARLIEANPALTLLRSKSGATTDQFMMTNLKPFTDVRVRQAFRLMIDRQQLLDNALSGYGRIGNDLHCITDPDYASELPQRAYDPDQAKSLLKQAGFDNSQAITLYTSDAAPGMQASATLIANQAKKIGVNIELLVVPPDSYYSGPNFKKTQMGSSDWGQHTLESQFGQGYARGAYWNEPDWTSDEFDKWVSKARTTFDGPKRREYYVEAQKVLWNEGAYIIWGFRDLLDAASAKVKNIVPSTQRNLGYYQFESVYLG
ncbi:MULTISPECIES: ABC transporter substrate-binding protein [unclassified Mesorhizobium]|uniref:ABC transporter substrate-binding protein n=2 Tax=Mesorhizobium TaxID=68287 RepID=UPI002416A9C5|nr:MULTISPECIES: ABC transporter substrate-binding protein [unclassified Mesorhizobium]MDG4900873.1 ABC transporter substrate-binding protein [Mesorhizobium sp. WSM4962]MDG4916888.1 ABC transporter substrate-binding protein [Mesorhizobium sp. WSM4989]